MNKKPLLIAGFVICISSFLWYFFSPKDDGSYQGYVEGEYLYIGSEEAGKIIAVKVKDGMTVRKGDVLFSLDDRFLLDLKREALAGVTQAEAQLRDLRSSLRRPEEIAILNAQKEKAAAQLEFSKLAFERQKALKIKGVTSEALYDQARAAFDRDKATLEETERQIEVGTLSSRSEAVKAGEAAVERAKASLNQIETRLERLHIRAPEDAFVQRVYYREGEVIAAGQPVLSLLPPFNKKLRFFVPEADIAGLKLGQKISISCDLCSNDLNSTISYISSSVEFTSPIIFSEQERAKLVFRVEASPFNEPDVPVGLPVSVYILNSHD